MALYGYGPVMAYAVVALYSYGRRWRRRRRRVHVCAIYLWAYVVTASPVTAHTAMALYSYGHRVARDRVDDDDEEPEALLLQVAALGDAVPRHSPSASIFKYYLYLLFISNMI